MGPANSSAGIFLAAIQSFAGMVPTTAVDASLVTSQALSLAQGTIASGANRFDSNVIAKYEFQTGTGLVAYETRRYADLRTRLRHQVAAEGNPD